MCYDIHAMTPIMIPVILYSLENARQEMTERTGHEYHIATVRKAARDGTLACIRVDERTVLVTSDAIEEYLRKHARYGQQSGLEKE